MFVFTFTVFISFPLCLHLYIHIVLRVYIQIYDIIVLVNFVMLGLLATPGDMPIYWSTVPPDHCPGIAALAGCCPDNLGQDFCVRCWRLLQSRGVGQLPTPHGWMNQCFRMFNRDTCRLSLGVTWYRGLWWGTNEEDVQKTVGLSGGCKDRGWWHIVIQT